MQALSAGLDPAIRSRLGGWSVNNILQKNYCRDIFSQK
jgi:hypothetical protein